MEHCMLAKKTIKKIEKNNTKQIPKKSLRLAQKNKISDINDSMSLIINNKETLLDSLPSEEFKTNFVKDPQAYLNIPEIPIYTPTLEEFRQPIPLINKLRELGYDKYGCVKLIAPEGWDPQFSLGLQDKKISTRTQVLQELTKGKCFKQNANSYTLNEYEKFANKFLKQYPRKSTSTTEFQDSYRSDEYEYWTIIDDPQFKDDPVAIEYAADLPTLRYGSAFPKLNKNKLSEISSLDDARIHSFNLNNLIHAKNSLFQIISKRVENISGITAPWVYAGMIFASFCWHVEDLYMYSVNYMHKGAAKTWYCVPSSHKEELERVIKEKYCELFIYHPDLLYNIVLTLNPLELVKRNIPVYRTEQKPREFIITFPRVYHAGFSHGFNISEAVNIATPDWIPFATMAMKDYAQDGFFKKGSFPFEWLIMENVKKIREFDFTLEAKKQIAKAYEDIMEKELRDRDTIKKCYTKMSTKHYSDLTSRYDAHICSTCKNYAYLSYLSCMVCKRLCCTHHITVCECLNATVILNVRFTDKNLTDFNDNITSNIKEIEQASQHSNAIIDEQTIFTGQMMISSLQRYLDRIFLSILFIRKKIIIERAFIVSTSVEWQFDI